MLLGGCKVGWFTFCITMQFFGECHALTCYKISNMLNLWLYLDFQLEYENICTIKFITHMHQTYNNENLKSKKMESHHVIPYLTNDIIINYYFNIILWTLESEVCTKNEPP